MSGMTKPPTDKTGVFPGQLAVCSKGFRKNDYLMDCFSASKFAFMTVR